MVPRLLTGGLPVAALRASAPAPPPPPRLRARVLYVCSLAVGREARSSAGTYPSGLLLLPDPVGGVRKSLGPPMVGRQSLRELLVGPSGTVYCGLGTPAAIVAYDPGTGRFAD